jgi:hypothetical protein
MMPGFVDAHVHLTSTGLSLENADVGAASSAEELIALARARASDGREGPVVLQGYDESGWDRPRVPTAAELDAVTARPLVIQRIDGHVALANALALAHAGAADLPGCERGPDGSPSGRVTLEANHRIGRWLSEARDAHRVEELQLAAAAEAAARGITSVHEMSMPAEDGFEDVEILLGHRDRLPVDVAVFVGTMDVARIVDLGLGAIGGDLAADGSIGARTAALRAPYVDGTGSGQVTFADDALAAFFHDAHHAGLQVGLHAIGDAAIEQVLVAWERVYSGLDSRARRHLRARRHRIEHAEMASPTQIERAAMLGIAASVQPAFDARWGAAGGLYETALGPARARAMNPFRSMRDRGLVVGLGSDAPVTPFDPWGTVLAVEQHHDPTERLSRAEAVALHTSGSAQLAHQESKKGTLVPGSHADMVAYDGDPLEADDPHGCSPILTISKGREVSAR